MSSVFLLGDGDVLPILSCYYFLILLLGEGLPPYSLDYLLSLHSSYDSFFL